MWQRAAEEGLLHSEARGALNLQVYDHKSGSGMMEKKVTFNPIPFVNLLGVLRCTSPVAAEIIPLHL